MDYWTNGLGWESIAVQQVAAELRGTDVRQTGQRARRRTSQVRRALAAMFVALATRLDPALAPQRRDPTAPRAPATTA